MRVLKTIGFDRDWARAEGAYLYDTDGNRFLDLLGGFGMFNVGRNNPRVRAALVEALELDLPGSVQLGASPLPPLLAEELLAPRRRRGSSACSSRAPAPRRSRRRSSSAARRRGRPRVLSAEHGFHGLTLGSLSANGNAEFTERFGPLLPGFDRVPFGDLDALEAELRREDVAVFLVEPVQGKGVNLPPAGYLEGAQELCRRYGTLFCVDEVQTGLGRTGRLFAFEHWGLEPDLVTVAKSLSGGYVPVGALLMAQRGVRRPSSTRSRTRSATARPSRRTTSRWPPGSRRCTSSTSSDLVERSARLGELLLELTRAAGRALRRRARRARARADVGDRVRASRRRGGARGGCSSACSRACSRSSSSCRSSPTTAS